MLTSSFPRIPCFSEASLLVLVNVKNCFMEHQSGKEMSQLSREGDEPAVFPEEFPMRDDFCTQLIHTQPSLHFPFSWPSFGSLCPLHRRSAKREIIKSMLLCFSQRDISVGRNLICLFPYFGLSVCVCVCVCVC